MDVGKVRQKSKEREIKRTRYEQRVDDEKGV